MKITVASGLCKFSVSHYVGQNIIVSVAPELRLGSAGAIFQKARIEKIGKNEPIWGLFKNIIWKSLILTKKDQFFS